MSLKPFSLQAFNLVLCDAKRLLFPEYKVVVSVLIIASIKNFNFYNKDKDNFT